MKIRLGGVPEHFNHLWHLPSTREIFRNRGYYYEWQSFPGGTGAMSLALEADETDVAIMLTEGAIAAIAQGKAFSIRSPFVVSPLVWGVFASANRPVYQLPAIQNAVFAVSRMYSGSHLMAQFLAQRSNVLLKEDQFHVSRDLDGARAALKSGAADYFLWEKWMTRYLVHQGEFIQVNEIAAPWPAFVFVTRKGVLEDWEPFAEALMDAITAFKNLSEEELIAELMAAFNISHEDIKAWLADVKYYDGNHYWPDRLVAAAMIMQGKGMITETPPLERLL